MISQVAQLMLTISSEATWNENGQIAEPDKGVVIHKLDGPTAAEIAAKVLPKKLFHPRMPLTYILACVGIESLFDPNADNGNFKGSNPDQDPLGYDVGLCQHKLRYLIGRKGIVDARSARAAALDIDYALDVFLQKMEGLMDWAFKSKGDPALPERAHNAYWLATSGYNFGTSEKEPGVLWMLRNDKVPHMDNNASHGDHVARYEVRFAQMLGQPSVMEDIVTKEESKHSIENIIINRKR